MAFRIADATVPFNPGFTTKSAHKNLLATRKILQPQADGRSFTRQAMEIFVPDIPEEGLHKEGEFPASIFDLDPGDSIRPTGPVRYSVDIYSFDDGIAFTGSLHGSFELQCGICLKYFDYDADFPHWASDLDLEEGQKTFDLKEIIREEFLLELPSHPRCDELQEDRICPKAAYLADPNSVEDEVPDEPPPDAWGALDDWQSKS